MASSLRQRKTVDEEAILGEALRLFAERGYQATTMDDIGAALGIKGPSLYNHVRSKHDLLVGIMSKTMNTLIRNQMAALDAGGDFATRLRRTVEAHVRFHAANPHEAFVGNREISSLEPDARLQILELRDAYEHRLRALIAEGCAVGEFSVPSPKLASYAILEMGIGVAPWFRSDGELSVDQVAYIYSDIAIRMMTERVPSQSLDNEVLTNPENSQ